MSKFTGRAFVVLFVIFDIVLIFFTLAHVNKEPVKSDIPDTAATSAAPAAGAQDPYDFKPATSTLVSSNADGSLVFAVHGNCDGTVASGAAISANSGDQVRASVTGVLTTLAVEAQGGGKYSLVGTNGQCEPVQINSSDSGRTWTPADDISLWYVDPSDVETVHAPGKGASKPGCSVTSLSDLGEDRAIVTCSDGQVIGTSNGGDKWAPLGRLDNIRVADFESPKVGYALAKFQGCAGQEFTTTDGGATWTAGGCITGDPAQGISAADGKLVAIVGSQLYRSADQGKTWSQPESAL